ncbi:MAG: hypothetical protein ACOCVH_02545 [Verrucomicrobiota bacterium]
MESETQSVEHGERVGSSRTFGITDHVALGVHPAGPEFTPGRSSRMQDKCGARSVRLEASLLLTPCIKHLYTMPPNCKNKHPQSYSKHCHGNHREEESCMNTTCNNYVAYLKKDARNTS